MASLINGTKARLVAGDIALGVAVRLARTVDIVPAMVSAGYDWLFIDLEHGSLSLDAAAQMSVAALAAGLTPIARVPSGEYGMAARLLGSGALGLVMPHIDTADEARELVDQLRYPPRGQRAVYGGMPHFGFRPVKGSSDILDHETLLIVMLETATAIQNAHEIAAVPGVDVLFVGANDLSSQMGIQGQFGHTNMVAAYQCTVEACRAHGKFAGIGGVYDAGIMAAQIAGGMQFLLCGSDLSFLMSAASEKAAQVRAMRPNAG